MIKCLVIVDDATHEAVAIVPAHSSGGEQLTRLLDDICAQRGKPSIIRSDNGPEFTGKAMLNWAHRNSIAVETYRAGQAEPKRATQNGVDVGTVKLYVMQSPPAAWSLVDRGKIAPACYPLCIIADCA